MKHLLSGEHDQLSCTLSVQASGDTVDARVWADMLRNMYTRWGERHGFTVKPVNGETVSASGGPGILLADISIEGEYAYGHLRSEVGVHRLVRISPFDDQARRCTTFASVTVVPDGVPEIMSPEEKDIEWGTQVRSYVLDPYQQVTDHRTGLKVSDAHAVIHGNLDELIQSYLQIGLQTAWPVNRQDAEGNSVTLVALCRKEPEWAAERIRELEARVKKMARVITSSDPSSNSRRRT